MMKLDTPGELLSKGAASKVSTVTPGEFGTKSEPAWQCVGHAVSAVVLQSFVFQSREPKEEKRTRTSLS